MRFNMKFELDRIPIKINNAMDKGQIVLDSEVLKDSNYYAPRDQGALIESGVRATNPGDGEVIWDTPYARRLYHNPQYNFSTDSNPNASGLWFERGKAANIKNWEKIIDKAVKKHL